MSNMKLIMESWRGYIEEAISTDISDAISKDVALCKAEKDNVEFYILYDPTLALQKLKYYTNYSGQYKNPPTDNNTNLNPFRFAVQDSILSVISLKPSTGGKNNKGPYDAKEINYVVSNKKGFGRMLYVMAMADHVLSSDRSGLVTKAAQDVWNDFYNNSQEAQKEPKTGNISSETLPKSGIVRVKIDNIDKPETETKEDDGKVYTDRGSKDPLNYVYFNFSKDKNAISALKTNHEEFVKEARPIVDGFNDEIEETGKAQIRFPLHNESFIVPATAVFRSRYKDIPDEIKYVKESRKLGKPSSETNLGDWFKRKGAPGKKGGWVDCNTCRDGKCKPCGRQEGEKRAKYPRCRPTPSQCKGYKRRHSNLQREE